jgi:NADH dehydrogenase
MKLVIIGGGFGGMQLVKALRNRGGFEITLVDKTNYHQFQPLFYQVATAGLDASNISFPLRKAFHDSKNVNIRMTTVQEINPGENRITTETGTIEYDVLVIATGATTNFFGNQNVEANAFPMKSTTEALEIRHWLLQRFEEALLTSNKEEREKLMTIVIVGGGPTGVELSGAVAEMKRYVLPKDFPELDFNLMKIYLLEGGGEVLEHMSDTASVKSLQYLQNLGVTVLLNTRLTDYDGSTVQLNNGQTILASTVIWAAGIKGNVPGGIKPELLGRGNRIKVDRYNKVQGYENVYAIGDIAYMETPLYPNSHPQVASVAIQQARLLGENLKKIERRSPKQVEEFEYYDKGSMATVGRNLAVVDIPRPKLHFGGFLAWLVWMFLHLMLILGVKNKVFVFTNWVYNYFTHDQSLRLIFKDFYRVKKAPELEKAKIST